MSGGNFLERHVLELVYDKKLFNFLSNRMKALRIVRVDNRRATVKAFGFTFFGWENLILVLIDLRTILCCSKSVSIERCIFGENFAMTYERSDIPRRGGTVNNRRVVGN